MSEEFWHYLGELIHESKIIIDREKGSTHPRYPGKVYPVNYGYLDGTTASDSSGVDIWVGTLAKKEIVGVLCTVDLAKKDTELKILFDCTDEEVQSILDFTNTDQMKSIVVRG